MARLYQPAGHLAGHGRVDGALHLHRLEDEQLLAFLDTLPLLDDHGRHHAGRGRSDVAAVIRIRELLDGADNLL